MQDFEVSGANLAPSKASAKAKAIFGKSAFPNLLPWCTVISSRGQHHLPALQQQDGLCSKLAALPVWLTTRPSVVQ